MSVSELLLDADLRHKRMLGDQSTKIALRGIVIRRPGGEIGRHACRGTKSELLCFSSGFVRKCSLENKYCAQVAKLVDALALGASGETRWRFESSPQHKMA